MSATSSPFGMRPAYHPSGLIRPTAYTIANGYNTTIYQNSPVKIIADGSLALAAVNDRFIGVFQGVEYTDSDQRRRVSNKWTASQVGTDVVAYASLDPAMVYEVQTNATLGQAGIGSQYDLTSVTGNAVTGLSSQMLDVASTAANAAVRVIGLSPGPDNAWDDLFVIVQVEISEHQNVADVAAY